MHWVTRFGETAPPHLHTGTVYSSCGMSFFSFVFLVESSFSHDCSMIRRRPTRFQSALSSLSVSSLSADSKSCSGQASSVRHVTAVKSHGEEAVWTVYVSAMNVAILAVLSLCFETHAGQCAGLVSDCGGFATPCYRVLYTSKGQHGCRCLFFQQFAVHCVE